MPFFDVNQRKIYYHSVAGPSAASNPNLTLLFIHGLGSSSSYFFPVIPRLAASGFACLALDTPGSALSPTPDGQNSTRLIADDVLALLSALEIQTSQVVAIGHSMGALVASELAATNELAGLVLIGPINPSPALAQAFSQRIEVVTEQGMEAMADSIPVSATGSESNPTHHAFIRALLLSQSVEGYVSLCRVIAEANEPDYHRIKCPLLIIAGSDDKTAPVEGAKAILEKYTAVVRKSTEVLSGVGHWQCVEAADQVAALVDGFANRLQHDLLQ